MTTFWRILLFPLIIGNLVFFAWAQGYFGKIDDGREPQRYKHQLDPDKLRIGGIVTSAALSAPAPDICRQLTELPLVTAQQLHEKFTQNAAANLRFELKLYEKPPSYWVRIPAQANRAAAEKKLLELKQLGVTDGILHLVEGPDQFAISLGLFESAENAQARLQSLLKQGVRSASVYPRPRPAEQADLIAHGPQEELMRHMNTALGTDVTSLSFTPCPNPT